MHADDALMDNYRGRSGHMKTLQVPPRLGSSASRIFSMASCQSRQMRQHRDACTSVISIHLPQKGMRYMSMLPLSSMSTLAMAARCSNVKMC